MGLNVLIYTTRAPDGKYPRMPSLPPRPHHLSIKSVVSILSRPDLTERGNRALRTPHRQLATVSVTNISISAVDISQRPCRNRATVDRQMVVHSFNIYP